MKDGLYKIFVFVGFYNIYYTFFLIYGQKYTKTLSLYALCFTCTFLVALVRCDSASSTHAEVLDISPSNIGYIEPS